MNKSTYSEEGHSAGVAILVWSTLATIFSIMINIETKNNFGAILSLIEAAIFFSLGIPVIRNKKYILLIPITILYSIDFVVTAFFVKIPASLVFIRVMLLILLILGTIKSNNHEKSNTTDNENDRTKDGSKTDYDDKNKSNFSDDNNHEESGDKKDYNSDEPTIDSEEYYYKILDLKPGATFNEIKKSYLEQIKKYHPDRVDNLGEEFLDLALKRTKEIVKAYQYFKKKFNIH